MKKQINRVLAMLLCALLLATMAPLAGFTSAAVSENSEDDFVLNTDNSLGKVLTSALDQEGEDTPNSIDSLSFSGKTATVTFKATQDCKIVVAVYDESGLQMLCSGYTAVTAEQTEATVIVSAETMPQYFTAKAFMLDDENKALCEAYESKDNTHAYEEFLAKTTGDFDEDLVVNFDESTETNFGVLTEDAVIVESTGSVNVLQSADEETGIYTFTNVNAEITNLQSGDVFYCEADGAAIALKVDTITFSDGMATIKAADDTELSDIFDYVKIDESKEASPEEMNSMTVGDGVTYLGSEAIETPNPAPARAKAKARKADVDIDGQYTTKYNFEVKYGVVRAGFEVAFNINVKIYYDVVLLGKDYIDASVVVSLSSSASVSIEGKIDLGEKLTLFKGEVPIFAGITAELKINPVIAASLSLKATVKNEAKFGFSHKTGVGTKKIKESTTEITPEVKGTVKLEFGLKVSLAAKFVEILKFEVSGKVFGQAVGTAVVPAAIDDEATQHDCTLCIEGVINVVIEFSAQMKIGTDRINV